MTGWEQAILAYTCFVVVHLPQIWAETLRLHRPRPRVVRTLPPSGADVAAAVGSPEVRAEMLRLCDEAVRVVEDKITSRAPVPGINSAYYRDRIHSIDGVDAQIHVTVDYTARPKERK